MIAVDTNLLVRFLIPADDPRQAAQAKALFDGNIVYIPTTVLLETTWILGRVYKVPRNEVVSAMRSLFSIESIRMEAPQRLNQALDWADQGFEIGDALHLAGAVGCDAFVTFDKDFVKNTRKSTAPVVRFP